MTEMRTRRGALKFIFLTVCGCLGALLIFAILHVRSAAHYHERVRFAKAKIESLKQLRPGNVADEKWIRGVDWTSNIISQIYFSPEHGDLVSLEDLCRFLERRTQQDVDLRTLRSIWDECEKVTGRGKRYAITFRDVRLLADEPIDDDDLPGLWSIDKCMQLDLSNTAVTNAGMPHLTAKSNISMLFLSGTKVGDDGLKSVVENSGLRFLDLSQTRVSNEGLRHLLTRPELTSLSLSMPIGDSGMLYVGKLSQLEELWLVGCQITDAGLPHLTGLNNLTQLDLTRTLVSETGILKLKDLAALKMLILQGVEISEQGKIQFKLAFPKCTIRY